MRSAATAPDGPDGFRTASRPVSGSSPSGLYITTSSARMPERASLSAPPFMQSTKIPPCRGAGEVVMITPLRCRRGPGPTTLCRRTSRCLALNNCRAAVDHQLHAIDIARVVRGEEQRGRRDLLRAAHLLGAGSRTRTAPSPPRPSPPPTLARRPGQGSARSPGSSCPSTRRPSTRA